MKNPTTITEKQEKQVRKYVKDFFEKAVEKDKERQKRRADRKVKGDDIQKSPVDAEILGDKKADDAEKSDDDRDMALSDDDEEKAQVESTTPATPLDQLSLEGLKRKRDQLLEEGDSDTENTSNPNKLIKSETPPPPPPPPAPVNGLYPDVDEPTDAEMDNAKDTPTEDLSGTLESSSIQGRSHASILSRNGTPMEQALVDGDGKDAADVEEHGVNGEDHGLPHPVHV